MYHRSVRRAGVIFLMCFVLLGLLVPATVSAAPAQPEKQSAAAQEGYGGFYYTVRPGDNLTRIANRFGTTVAAIMHANGLHSSVIYVGQVLYIPAGSGGGGGGGSCGQTYIVQPGDTLSGIARRFGVSTYELARCNGISNPSFIYVGQRLCIPSGGYNPYPPAPPPPPPPPPPGSCGQYYTVQRGNTLSGIARWCGTTTQNLMYLNGLANPNFIYVGQVLRIW